MEKKIKRNTVTFEQFKEECEKRDLELKETKYLGPHGKHLCIDKEGYKVMVIRNQTIRCNRATMPFHEDNPYTIDNIKKWFEKEQILFELIEGQTYKNNRTRFKIKCNVCEQIVEMTWANIKRKKGCGSCNGTQVTDYNSFEKHFPDKVKYFKNPEEAKRITKGSQKKIKTICPDCGEESTRVVKNIAKQGYGCTNCDTNSFWNLENREQFKKEWKEKPCLVYTIKCWDENEIFFKIGITTKTVKERFRKEKDLPYEFEVLEEIQTNLYDAIAIEFLKHKKLKKEGKQYFPKKTFAGITECFKEL